MEDRTEKSEEIMKILVDELGEYPEIADACFIVKEFPTEKGPPQYSLIYRKYGTVIRRPLICGIDLFAYFALGDHTGIRDRLTWWKLKGIFRNEIRGLLNDIETEFQKKKVE